MARAWTVEAGVGLCLNPAPPGGVTAAKCLGDPLDARVGTSTRQDFWGWGSWVRYSKWTHSECQLSLFSQQVKWKFVFISVKVQAALTAVQPFTRPLLESWGWKEHRGPPVLLAHLWLWMWRQALGLSVGAHGAGEKPPVTCSALRPLFHTFQHNVTGL